VDVAVPIVGMPGTVGAAPTDISLIETEELVPITVPDVETVLTLTVNVSVPSVVESATANTEKLDEPLDITKLPLVAVKSAELVVTLLIVQYKVVPFMTLEVTLNVSLEPSSTDAVFGVTEHEIAGRLGTDALVPAESAVFDAEESALVTDAQSSGLVLPPVAYNISVPPELQNEVLPPRHGASVTP
jgi:hypothetical protein